MQVWPDELPLPLLYHLDLEAAAGDVVALVGLTQYAKNAMSHLILGSCVPNQVHYYTHTLGETTLLYAHIR